MALIDWADLHSKGMLEAFLMAYWEAAERRITSDQKLSRSNHYIKNHGSPER